ncbi:hypothetical protein [Herbiconiux ginsengi]|uniref:Antitoxin VbhA domain-containing protein n=1 Tax=Herbiconiux ginsengi TaxID=381665 RepID=A0A1H3TG74_9MICO|nr:hypothetical protein [Herbiconiux ginsengi]SDZ48329.1 hypothetical protein SAMN05216554_4114 [Herbiconiux ginsengi]
MASKTRSIITTADGRRLDPDREMAMVEKGQQLAGHFPDAEALERGRRVLDGDLTVEEARAEIAAKYSR